MVVKWKERDVSDAFVGCGPRHRNDLEEVIFGYDGLFQDPKGFPLKREIEHEIHLQ